MQTKIIQKQTKIPTGFLGQGAPSFQKRFQTKRDTSNGARVAINSIVFRPSPFLPTPVGVTRAPAWTTRAVPALAASLSPAPVPPSTANIPGPRLDIEAGSILSAIESLHVGPWSTDFSVYPIDHMIRERI